MIRYAETLNLNTDLSRQLLKSLTRLSDTDPYFRAGDWGRYPIHCFNQLALVENLRKTILDERHAFHLRGFLLEALYDEHVIAQLAPDLDATVRNTKLVYRERSDASNALAKNTKCVDWPHLVNDLVALGDKDSTRLAVELIREVGFALFSDSDVALAVLTESGFYLTRSEARNRNQVVGTFIILENQLPDERIHAILDALAADVSRYRIEKKSKSEEGGLSRSEFNRFVRQLVLRQIRLSPPDPETLWKWLNTLETEYGGRDDARSAIAQFLIENDRYRKSVQRHVMLTPDGYSSRQSRNWHMARLSPGLLLQDLDILDLLEETVKLPSSNETARETWKMLVSASRNEGLIRDEVRNLALPFADEDQELLDWIDPPPREPSDWEKDDEEWEIEKKADEQKKLSQLNDDRTFYRNHIEKLRKGDLEIIGPAKSYLGLHYDADNSHAPLKRVEEWLGSDITEAAIEGFENVLTRTDLPSGREIAENHSKGTTLNYAFPICVGLSRKIQNGSDLNGIDIHVIEAGRIGQHCNLNVVDDSTKQLGSELDKILLRDAETFEHFARSLVEPQIENDPTYIVGLHNIIRQHDQRSVAIKLATEWLEKYPQLPDEVVRDLIGCLCNAEGSLRDTTWNSLSIFVAEKLRSKPAPGDTTYWLAVYYLVNFPSALELISDENINDNDFFWRIRDALIPDRFDDSERRFVSPEQATWVISNFRSRWPHSERPGGTTGGSQNSWDATSFIDAMIYRLASFNTEEADRFLTKLNFESNDGYSASLKNAYAQQLQRKAEEYFEPASVSEILNAIADKPPMTARDIQAIVLDEIDNLQHRLKGASTDPIDSFFDTGVPKTEPKCRNAMLNLMAQQLPHGIHWSPEEAMPKGTFADVGFRRGALVVPLEAKGQWHKEVWTSATNQLKKKYSSDYRSSGSGIYVVFWFGEQTRDSNKKLCSPPHGLTTPSNAKEMQAMLEITLSRSDALDIAVRVLDLSGS